MIYNQFSDEYNRLFLENLSAFTLKGKETGLSNDYFVSFYPSFGIKSQEPCDFLILGQAVNGWASGFQLEDPIHESLLEKSIECSNSYLKELNHTPLDWVNVKWTRSYYRECLRESPFNKFYEEGNYTAYRSFFWNVIFKLISDYYGFNRNTMQWSKKMVWSNLYKIAPENSNPDHTHIKLQQALSIKLIKKELEELKPKYCIVITNGTWWQPFRKNLSTESLEFDDSLSEILFFENFQDTKIIVTTRPFMGKSENHVKQILGLLKK